jgi:dihydroorotate dehydrogenase (NAD+) catalytic subunit
MINTITGIAVDINTRKPKLGNITGGLSGPAVKPIGLRCVWQAFNTVKIPIIGMGGISNSGDALEYIISGAAAVSIGTATFLDPLTAVKTIKGIEKYFKDNGLKNMQELIGSLKI